MVVVLLVMADAGPFTHLRPAQLEVVPAPERGFALLISPLASPDLRGQDVWNCEEVSG